MTRSTPLRTHVRRSGTATTVQVSGELDVATAGTLARTLAQVAADRPSLVVVDLSGLAFMDATGLSALLRGSRTVGAAGGRLCLSSPSPMVRTMLRLLDLTDVLPVTAGQNSVGVPGSRPRSSS